MSLPVRDREMEDMTLTMHREGKLRNKESKGRDRGRAPRGLLKKGLPLGVA